MIPVCVDGAMAMIIGIPPGIILKPVDKISGGAQSKVKAGGKAALIDQDVQKWAKQFTCPYMSVAAVIPGTLKGVSASPIMLSMRTKAQNKPVVLQSTMYMLTLSVNAPAQIPAIVPVPDPVPVYQAMVMFASPGQMKLSSF